MSRSMKIQDLLSRSLIASDSSHTESRGSSLGATPHYNSSTFVRKTPPSEKSVQFKPPGLNLLTSNLFPEENHSVPRRKRKLSPDEAVLIRRPARLPRYSVNIFSAEPPSAYPIPYQGIVPRMTKYCKTCRRYYDLLTILIPPDFQTWAVEHGTALHIEGHPSPYQSLVFPYSLQHAALFESMLCIARTSWLMAEGIPCHQDKALMHHRTNAFAALALRLASQETCADDTTILTIAALSTVDVRTTSQHFQSLTNKGLVYVGSSRGS